MSRNRLAVAVALVLFLVLTGTGVSNAYWSSQATGTATVKVASLAGSCNSVTSLVNGSFEKPAISESLLRMELPSNVPGWNTTDTAIEIWKTGADGVPAGAGRQFIELNAHIAGTLSQTIATIPGQTLYWSLLHRGRLGTDTVSVRLGAPNSEGTLQGTLVDNTTWGRHSGLYVVPAGQTTTKLSLNAISSAGGSVGIGNFLDDISLGTGPCLTAATTVTNVTSPGTAPRVGDTLEYTTTVTNKGGSPSATTQLGGTLPAALSYQAGSLRVTGAGATDTTGDDSAEFVSSTRTFSARVGLGSSGKVGGAIAPEESATFTLRAVVTVAAAGTTINYGANAITYADPLAPGWPIAFSSNAVSSAIPAIADLATSQTVTNNKPIPGGATSPSWSITVKNNGPQSATDVVVRVVAPAGLASPTVSGSGSTCSQVTGMTLTWDCILGTVATGASKVVTVAGTIPITYNGTATLGVTATARGTLADHVPTNNSSTGEATVEYPVKNATPYRIQMVGSAQPLQCLDASYGLTSAGTSLGIWDCQVSATETPQQRWKFTRDSAGYYSVQLAKDNAPVFWNAASNSAGATVSLQNSSTSALQHWSIKPTATAGQYQFVNRSGELCLANVWGTMTMQNCNSGSAGQLFLIQEMGL